MTAYTVQDDPDTVRTITSHLNKLREAVLKDLTDTVALVLMGGFSRGEGSVVKEAGRVVPLGDYDLLAITRRPHPVGTRLMAARLAPSFGIDHIDLGMFWYGLLPFVGKRIYWYELKFGSRLLFGDGRVLRRIPIRGASEIDPYEGLRLMFNRLQGMLRDFDPRFLAEPPPLSLRRRLVFESIKGVLACGDALLILRGMYHYSYRQRLLNLKRLASRSPRSLKFNGELLRDFEEATRLKLQPAFADSDCFPRVWFAARDHLLDAIRHCWEAYSGHTADGSASFPHVFLRNSAFKLLDYLMYSRSAIVESGLSRALFRLDVSPSDVIRAALYSLASSVRPNGIDEEALNEALRLAAHMAPHARKTLRARSPIAQWLDARDIVGRAWSISRK